MLQYRLGYSLSSVGMLDEHSLHFCDGPINRTKCTTTYRSTFVPTNDEITSSAIKLIAIDSVDI